ncbi:forkhead box protein N1 [Hemicordylus capensis]|uniref:forkhead box protein N1 n=1 Tax=Hemicordylus capensis TaxID=884348 RepID=UPI002302BB9E|nr:forkhead box protein N1 [Hemicordylus capensis]
MTSPTLGHHQHPSRCVSAERLTLGGGGPALASASGEGARTVSEGKAGLKCDQHGNRMQTHENSSSPVQQKTPGFCCQPYDGSDRTERTNSESSQSPSPSSPSPDQIYGRFCASQAIHTEEDAFKASSAAEKFRRYSYEESAAGTCGRFLKNSSRNPFHPYKRQFTEEACQEARQALGVEGHPFKPASMDGYEEMAGPTVTPDEEMYAAHCPNLTSELAWCNGLQYNHPGQEQHSQMMDTDVKLKTTLDGHPSFYCYQSQVPQMYCSSHPFHQYSSESSYPVTYISAAPYPYQRIAPQNTQEQHQPLFPKPIYSYSILIFMALKNSKTGSLPVSEIYNFMTEHFPYFKTAPDGWKNSVRHNLSLNKCFEKVENKTGSSSRKGCLWALNPAKIDKMQEELQKWKRKDPIAVRKSMAKPEELDTLIGDKMDKLRSTMLACNPSGVTGPSGPARQMTLQHHSLHTQLKPAAQGSPLPAQTPPGRGMKLLSASQTVDGVLLLEGDLSDVDALNPSLTDFDLQGNIWEELKDDSLAVDPLVLISSSLPSSHGFSSQCQMDDATNNNDLSTYNSPQPQTLPEVQLTTLYSAFMELDTGSTSYLNNSGSKPVALV